MCEQSIRDRAGKVWTGRLTDHLGNGLAEIDVDGKRHIGVKVQAPADDTISGQRFVDLTSGRGWVDAR